MTSFSVVLSRESGAGESGARAVCRACAVRLDCRSFAEASHQRYGVWGGTTEDERRVRE
ncbi:WhiB family transcriptional regulator [Streptomyces sp. NPDC059459]|uniref:WhiB family transcriptional regulator n=1 Tax=Streptomyces sp. NPDC059459 TaxID=3346839 RepID=UPI0036A1A019